MSVFPVVHYDSKMLVILPVAGIFLAPALAIAAIALPVHISVLLLASLVVLLVAVIVAHVFGVRQLIAISVLLAAATMAWNDLRLTSWATFSDLFVLLALIVTLLIRGFSLPKKDSPLSAVGIGLTLILLGGFLSSLYSGADTGHSLSALLRFGVASVGMLLLFQSWTPTHKQLEAVSWAWILSAFISSVYAIAFEPELRFLDRSAGLTVHPNHFAVTSVFAIALALPFLWKPGPIKIVSVVAIALLLAAVFYSGSRTGIVGLASIAVVFTLTSKGVSLWSMLGLIAFAGVLALSSGIITLSIPEQTALGRILSSDDVTSTSDAQRLEILRESLRNIEENPISGSGFANARDAHNIYLQVWSSAGVLGLAGFGLIVTAVVLRPLFRLWRDFYVADPLLLGVIAAVVAYVTVGLFQPQIWDRYVWFILMLCAVTLTTSDIRRENENGVAQSHKEFRNRSKIEKAALT